MQPFVKQQRTHPKRSGKKSRKMQRGAMVVVRSVHPPPVVIQSVRSFKVRTLASGAIAGYQMLMSDIGGLLGVTARTATTSYYLSALTRLRRVTFWGPVATAGTPVSVTLTWTNNSEDFETPPITKTDTSISFDSPAFLDLRPPKSSLSSKWHSSGLTDPLAVINCPSGSTVDFEIDWVLDDGPNVPSLNGPVLVAANPGEVYHHPFSNLVPVGLNVL